MGHQFQLMSDRLVMFAKFGRGLAGNVAKDAAERTQARPAGLEGDVGDGQVGVAQQRGRLFDPPRQEVAVRGKAERLA